MRKLLAFLFVCAAGIGLAMPQQTIDEQRPAARDVEITIENIAGSVTVVGWDREELQITGTLGEGTKELDVDGDRNSWDIEVELHSNRRNIEGSNLEIRMPRGGRLTIETVSADIDVSDFDGTVELESVSGKILVQGNPSEVELATVSGSIRLVSEGAVGSGEFQSVSGKITLQADLEDHGRFEFETVSGNIDLRIPSKISARFDISSFSGRITNDFGEVAVKTSPYLPSEELTFSVGGGGARVTVKTVSGNVRLIEE
ncbi:MAG: DUF4097 family beta strand repeat-containing protein [Acidobacteria bacterium]|nr:DUF4097 family beta strand repeat-containing protein [Acidobacteriota bacterium]